MKRGIELPGRLILSWFSAGSLISGGWLVAYALFHEKIAHYYLLYTIAILYMLGGFAGIFFSGALGMFGRPLEMKISAAFKDQLKGVLYAIPAAGIGFVVAGWIGLTYWAVYSMNIAALGFVTISWLVSGVIIALALEYGWFGLHNIISRIKSVKLGKIKIKITFE